MFKQNILYSLHEPGVETWPEPKRRPASFQRFDVSLCVKSSALRNQIPSSSKCLQIHQQKTSICAFAFGEIGVRWLLWSIWFWLRRYFERTGRNWKTCMSSCAMLLAVWFLESADSAAENYQRTLILSSRQFVCSLWRESADSGRLVRNCCSTACAPCCAWWHRRAPCCRCKRNNSNWICVHSTCQCRYSKRRWWFAGRCVAAPRQKWPLKIC